MTELALIDSVAEATGHPAECTEPAPGTVTSTSSTGIKVTVGGTTKEIASLESADIDIPSHGHDTDVGNNCIDFQSHTIDPDTGEPSIKINGSAVYLVENAVTTDPITGGNVSITTNSLDTDITFTEV